MYQNIPTKVLTGEVRLSYANLTKPRAQQPGAEEKYSVTLLIPKGDVATKADIDRSIEAAARDGLTKCWNNARPPQLRIPIYDGDGVRPSGEAFGEECRGHWVMTASSKQKPQVVDGANIGRELTESDIYSGMFARVTINFFAYANSGNKGVGCGLGNVMKTKDGEPLSGRSDAASDFAGLGQVAASYNAPPAYARPQQPAAIQMVNPLTGQPMLIDPATGAILA